MKEKELEKILKALGNNRRLSILKILKTKKRRPVGSIAEEIKLSFKATSKHLSILYANNIIEREQMSLQMYYYLSESLPESSKMIISLL